MGSARGLRVRGWLLLLTREIHMRCEGGSLIRVGMRVGTLCDGARPYH